MNDNDIRVSGERLAVNHTGRSIQVDNSLAGFEGGEEFLDGVRVGEGGDFGEGGGGRVLEGGGGGVELVEGRWLSRQKLVVFLDEAGGRVEYMLDVGGVAV